MAKTSAALRAFATDTSELTLGKTLRARRHAAELRLVDLAARSDVSAGYLSQVEHDRICPSIVALGRIAKALNTTVAAIFTELDEGTRSGACVVRRDARKTLLFPNSATRNELLVGNLQGALEVMWSRIPPGAKSPIFRHEGEECGVIISGKLTYWVGNEEYLLEPGDAISYKSDIPHRYENRTKREVETIWIITPPGF
jgi:quercetin dioxygenase-like cupin family protein/DNA-binding XRE family transcriptional regulator